MEYGDCHRLFLQTLMTEGILNASQVRRVIEYSDRACGSSIDINDKNTLKYFIQTIDNKIKPLDMKIKMWIDEDGKRKERNTNYVLVSTRARSTTDFPMLTSKAVDFKEKEIEYLKLMVDRILTSEHKELCLTRALNMTSQLKPGKQMSMKEGETTIKAFIAKKWLKLCEKKENIRLSVRFLAEMETYLLDLHRQAQSEEFEDDEDHPGRGVAICASCGRLVVRSVDCKNCKIAFHLFCAAKFADTQDSSRLGSTLSKCGKCKQALVLATASPVNKKRRRIVRPDDSDDE